MTRFSVDVLILGALCRLPDGAAKRSSRPLPGSRGEPVRGKGAQVLRRNVGRRGHGRHRGTSRPAQPNPPSDASPREATTRRRTRLNRRSETPVEGFEKQTLPPNFCIMTLLIIEAPIIGGILVALILVGRHIAASL